MNHSILNPRSGRHAFKTMSRTSLILGGFSLLSPAAIPLTIFSTALWIASGVLRFVNHAFYNWDDFPTNISLSEPYDLMPGDNLKNYYVEVPSSPFPNVKAIGLVYAHLYILDDRMTRNNWFTLFTHHLSPILALIHHHDSTDWLSEVENILSDPAYVAPLTHLANILEDPALTTELRRPTDQSSTELRETFMTHYRQLDDLGAELELCAQSRAIQLKQDHETDILALSRNSFQAITHKKETAI